MAREPSRKPLTHQEAINEREMRGVPDWKIPSQYEYVKNLKGDRLRWEFLRRNTNYRKKYDQDHSQIHILLGEWINPKKRGDELKEDFVFADTARRGQPLRLTPPPIQDMLFRKGEVSPDWKMYARFGHELTELMDEGYLILVFDPLRSPTQQLNSARNFLNDAKSKIEAEERVEENRDLPQQNAPRKRAITLKDPIKLLRVLDAYNEGVSDKDIGIEIYGINPADYSDAAATGHQHLARAKNYWRKL